MDTVTLLMRGKLQQTCPDCGRWEAAGASCSWCHRPTGKDDWYRNGDQAEHRMRMPLTAPANPPTEYRRKYRPAKGDGWPPAWGPNPYASTRGTPP